MQDPKHSSSKPSWWQEWKETELSDAMHECANIALFYVVWLFADFCLWVATTIARLVWGFRILTIVSTLFEAISVVIVGTFLVTSALRIMYKMIKGTFKEEAPPKPKE